MNQTSKTPLMGELGVTKSFRNSRMSGTLQPGKLGAAVSQKEEILTKQYSMGTTAFGSSTGFKGSKGRVKSGIDRTHPQNMFINQGTASMSTHLKFKQI